MWRYAARPRPDGGGGAAANGTKSDGDDDSSTRSTTRWRLGVADGKMIIDEFMVHPLVKFDRPLPLPTNTENFAGRGGAENSVPTFNPTSLLFRS